MDIHIDIHGFLEIHVWICYGFSDQGHRVQMYQSQFFEEHVPVANHIFSAPRETHSHVSIVNCSAHSSLPKVKFNLFGVNTNLKRG